jgi:hypothetical protein
MRKNIFLVCSLIFIIAIFKISHGNCNMNCESNEEKAIAEIYSRASVLVKKKWELSLISWGNSSGTDSSSKIKTLEVSFMSYKKLDMTQSRNLILDVSQLFLEAINTNKNIIPHVSVFPLTYKDIDVSIFMHNPDQSIKLYPDVSIVSLDHGNITYDYVDPEDIFNYKETRTETYEEAIEKDKLYNSKNN